MYGHRRQLAFVFVCATGAAADFVFVVAALALAGVAAALVDPLVDPLVDDGTAATVGVATGAVLLAASSMDPPMPKNDATLRPASKMRDAFAGWCRRAAGREPVVVFPPSVGGLVGEGRLLEAARRSWSRRSRSAWSSG